MKTTCAVELADKDGAWRRCVSRQDNETQAHEFVRWMFKDCAIPTYRIVEIKYGERILAENKKRK